MIWVCPQKWFDRLVLLKISHGDAMISADFEPFPGEKEGVPEDPGLDRRGMYRTGWVPSGYLT